MVRRRHGSDTAHLLQVVSSARTFNMHSVMPTEKPARFTVYAAQRKTPLALQSVLDVRNVVPYICATGSQLRTQLRTGGASGAATCAPVFTQTKHLQQVLVCELLCSLAKPLFLAFLIAQLLGNPLALHPLLVLLLFQVRNAGVQAGGRGRSVGNARGGTTACPLAGAALLPPAKQGA